MPEPPYVSAEAWDEIGVESERVMEPVSLRHIREYLAAVDDWNPAYHDAVRAAEGPHGGVIGPPLFFLAACRRVAPMSQLLEDGQYNDVMVPGVHGRSVVGTHEAEVFAPVVEGDVLTVREKVSNIDEKQGRSGKLVIVTKDAIYTNQRGERVATDSLTLIFR